MPPKKKNQKKSDDSGAATETPDQQEWKQLKSEADNLHKLTKKEEREFNEFQQQREKLNYFWIVEKKKLEDRRVELRNKIRELQDLEEKHVVEIKIYKQRLRHLLYEHQNEVASKKTDTERALKMAQDDDKEVESDLKEDKSYANQVIREARFTHEEFIRSLKREQDVKVTALRHEYERKNQEIQKNYDAKMKLTREQLDKQRKAEIKRIEEFKASKIDLLINVHQKAFSDIKNYYNDITHNNLDLIKSLKEEVKDLEIEEKKDQQRLHEKMNENKKLSAPLKKMQDDVLKLRSDLEEYKKEKIEMEKVKAALLLLENSQSSVQWQYETLYQRLIDLKLERDQLASNLKESMYEVKQKSSFKTLLLDKKINALKKIQEEREAQLNEVLNHANLEPGLLNQVKGKVDDIMLKKNNEIKKYQLEIVKLEEKHVYLREKIANRLKDFGLNMKEMGFEPALFNKTQNSVATTNLTNTLNNTGISMSTTLSRSGPALYSEPY